MRLEIGQRVRFRTEYPGREPVGTVIEAGYAAVKVEWDAEGFESDSGAPQVSIIERDRWLLLEVV